MPVAARRVSFRRSASPCADAVESARASIPQERSMPENDRTTLPPAPASEPREVDSHPARSPAPAAGAPDSGQLRLRRAMEILPEAMKARDIDLYIVFTRENARDPFAEEVGLGRVVAR